MKRWLLSLCMLFGLLIIPMAAHAATFSGICTDTSTPEAQSSTFCKETGKGTTSNPLGGQNGIFTSVIQIIGLISGIAAVILIIIGALQYVLAAGDPSKINQAKNYILYAIIGLVVTVIAQSVVTFVLKKL